MGVLIPNPKTSRLSINRFRFGSTGLAALPSDCCSALSLVEEASKMSLGQQLVLSTSYPIGPLLDLKGPHWLTGSLLSYQVLLLENPQVKIEKWNPLNPATLMPLPDRDQPIHSCCETLEQTYASGQDLKEQPFDNPEENWFTDGSSFVRNGTSRVGYAVISLHQITEARSLLSGTSAQLAE